MSIINEIVSELDTFIAKYKREKADFKIAGAYKERAKQNCLFVDGDTPAHLIDLSGIRGGVSNNKLVLYALRDDVVIEPVNEVEGVDWETVMTPSKTSIIINGYAFALVNGYSYETRIKNYDITKGASMNFKVQDGSTAKIYGVSMPKVMLPSIDSILRFTQIVAQGTSTDIQQSIEVNGGNGATPTDESLKVNVNTNNSTYTNAKPVKVTFPVRYDSYGSSTQDNALIEFAPDMPNARLFKCTVHWTWRYKNITSRITSSAGSASNYVFLRLYENTLHIICGKGGVGSYSFDIKGNDIDDLIRLLRQNPNTPVRVTLFNNVNVSLDILAAHFREINIT